MVTAEVWGTTGSSPMGTLVLHGAGDAAFPQDTEQRITKPFTPTGPIDHVDLVTNELNFPWQVSGFQVFALASDPSAQRCVVSMPATVGTSVLVAPRFSFVGGCP